MLQNAYNDYSFRIAGLTSLSVAISKTLPGTGFFLRSMKTTFCGHLCVLLVFFAIIYGKINTSKDAEVKGTLTRDFPT
jgi:hypothetical protein